MSSNSTHKIGLLTATIVGMNAMIGAGIFSVPAALGSSVGPAGILTYLLVIVAIWFMGQSLARVGYLYPKQGSFYNYTSRWSNHIWGLISAGSYLIGVIIAMGLLVQFAGNYLHSSFPSLTSYQWGVITLVALTALNIIGVKLSRAGQLILICCTTFPILATSIICFMHGSFANYTPFMPYGLGNVLEATRAVIFGFFGFEAAASLFNVVENPERNVPRALQLSILCVGILYLIFVAGIIYAIPLNLLSPTLPLSDALRHILPGHKWIIGLIHFSILSAILGTIHSMIWSTSELLLSYLGLMENKWLQTKIKTNVITQRVTVVLIAIAIFITFTTLNNITLFFSLTATFIVFAMINSMITLLTLKSEWESGQNYRTIIGLATALLILYFAIEGIFVSLF